MLTEDEFWNFFVWYWRYYSGKGSKVPDDFTVPDKALEQRITAFATWLPDHRGFQNLVTADPEFQSASNPKFIRNMLWAFSLMVEATPEEIEQVLDKVEKQIRGGEH